AWAIANGEPEIALGLDGALWRFSLARGAVAEARGVLDAALASGRGDPALRVKALNAVGILAGSANDFASARASFEEALDLAREVGDPRKVARALMNLGVIAMYTEELEMALARYGAAGDIWRELGDVRGQSVMHQNMANVYMLL